MITNPWFNVSIKGLKCDSNSCDWIDMNIPVEDYHLYWNTACPKCGQNILTDKDYRMVLFLLKIQLFFTKIYRILPKFIQKRFKQDYTVRRYTSDGNGNIRSFEGDKRS